MRVEQIGSATLIHGDATDHLAELRAAACVLTDPPFGIAYKSNWRTDALWDGDEITGDNDVTLRDYVLGRLHGRPMLVFGSWKAPRPPGTRHVLIWDQGGALGMGDLSMPWKPSAQEIHVIGKSFVGKRDEGSVLHCPPVQSMAKNGRLHPNEKPVLLLQRLLAKMPPGPVADPFLGSASAAHAALLAGRPFIGCETSERYFDIACERVTALQRDLFIEPPRVGDDAYDRPDLFPVEG
jgi:DNA modification methylase